MLTGHNETVCAQSITPDSCYVSYPCDIIPYTAKQDGVCLQALINSENMGKLLESNENEILQYIEIVDALKTTARKKKRKHFINSLFIGGLGFGVGFLTGKI